MNPTFNVNEDLDGGGWTALHLACRNGHHEVVSVLLSHSQINANHKCNLGSIPFRLGCSNGQVEVVKVLLRDSCVDIDMVDNNDRTPLWWTSLDGS
jgi:ankyrin repeat protein